MKKASQGEIEESVQQMVEWMDENVPKKPWTNKEIVKKFAKRTVQEILRDGDTGFMNPCSDLTLVAWTLLKEKGLKPVLVVEKLQPVQYDFVHLHFALEFIWEEEVYSLEFGTKGHVILKKGEYAPRRDTARTISIVRVHTDIRSDQTMLSVLENEVDLSDFKFDAVLGQLQRDNLPQTYANYVAQSPRGGRLYLTYDS